MKKINLPVFFFVFCGSIMFFTSCYVRNNVSQVDLEELKDSEKYKNAYNQDFLSRGKCFCENVNYDSHFDVVLRISYRNFRN